MRRPGRLSLSLAILVICTTVALAARWTDASSGLPGTVAAVKALVIDGATGSTLYAHTSGGIFKSTDGGANWKVLGNIAGVAGLALDPTSASTIYAGTASGAFKSADGGESWTSAGLSGMSIDTLAVDPITSSTLYASGAGDKIYKSTDGGGSWTGHAVGFPPSPYPGVSSILLDRLTPSTLYVMARGLGSALYKSTDAGESWNVINPGPFARLLAIDPVTPSTLYSIRFGSGFSKSTDGGVSWTSTGFTKDVIALAIDPMDSNTLYASTSSGTQGGQAIYKSTDGGQGWNIVNASVPLAASLVLSPANSSTVYAATSSGGVFKSTDAGMNWSASNTGLSVLQIRTLVVDPVDSATIYAGSDDGLFKSSDSGRSWKLRVAFQLTCCALPPGLPPPTGFPTFATAAPAGVDSLLIDFTNPDILYADTVRTNGCYFGDILLFKSADGGANWSDNITPKDSGCLAAGLMGMDPTDPNILYLRYGFILDGYGLLKSTDGGAHWNYGGLSADLENVLAIDPNMPSTLYAGTDSGVSQSSDGGVHWNLIALAKANVNLLAIDPHQSQVLYAGTAGAWPDTPGFRGLFKSTDGGANWLPINEGLQDVLDTRSSVNAFIVDPDHANVLYVATSGYGVFKSIDGGGKWAPFNDGLTQVDVRLLAIARGASTSVFAGTPSGVFRIVEDGN